MLVCSNRKFLIFFFFCKIGHQNKLLAAEKRKLNNGQVPQSLNFIHIEHIWGELVKKLETLQKKNKKNLSVAKHNRTIMLFPGDKRKMLL